MIPSSEIEQELVARDFIVIGESETGAETGNFEDLGEIRGEIVAVTKTGLAYADTCDAT